MEIRGDAGTPINCSIADGTMSRLLLLSEDKVEPATDVLGEGGRLDACRRSGLCGPAGGDGKTGREIRSIEKRCFDSTKRRVASGAGSCGGRSSRCPRRRGKNRRSDSTCLIPKRSIHCSSNKAIGKTWRRDWRQTGRGWSRPSGLDTSALNIAWPMTRRILKRRQRSWPTLPRRIRAIMVGGRRIFFSMACPTWRRRCCWTTTIISRSRIIWPPGSI